MQWDIELCIWFELFDFIVLWFIATEELDKDDDVFDDVVDIDDCNDVGGATECDSVCRSFVDVDGWWVEFEFEPADGLVDAEPGDDDDERSAVCAW